jgi:hypothetical protein
MREPGVLAGRGHISFRWRIPTKKMKATAKATTNDGGLVFHSATTAAVNFICAPPASLAFDRIHLPEGRVSHSSVADAHHDGSSTLDRAKETRNNDSSDVRGFGTA